MKPIADLGVLAETPEEGAQLAEQWYAKCLNPRCQFYNAPEIADNYNQLADQALAGEVNPEQLMHTCPVCGHRYNFVAQPGRKGQKKLAPGGTSHSGLAPSVQGQIGEDLVEKLGVGDFAGYGPWRWFHQGGADKASAFDALLQDWGVEIKTIDWIAENTRFVVGPDERLKKNMAAQDPSIFAQKLNDPALLDALTKFNISGDTLKGILGVLVLLDFRTSKADVFVREFPLSTWGYNAGRPLKGVVNFRHKNAIHIFADVPFDNPLPDPSAEGFVPHHERSEEAFGTPFDDATFSKTALDYAGDALPGQEPQAVSEQESSLSPNEWEFKPQSYKFFYANGELRLSPDHSHDKLREGLGVSGDHAGPVAAGHVTVKNGKASWKIDTNAGLGGLVEVLQDYTEKVGWTWEGIDTDDRSIADQFASKKSLYFAYDPTEDHLALSYDQASVYHLASASAMGYRTGSVTVQGSTVDASRVEWSILPALTEWAQDNGLHIVAGNDNVIKRIEDLDQWNLGDNDAPLQRDNEPHDRDRLPTGVFKCPDCSRLFPNWHVYMQHRRSEEPINTDDPFEDGKFPEIEENAIQDSHTTPLQPEIFPIAFVHTAGPLTKNPKHPKDWLEAEVPFIYDIEGDAIYVGAPGSRHSDIADMPWSPGGIVEGVYEPGGKVFIKSQTNTPYTIRHMLDLWYYQHPEFEVKSVTLRDGQGNERKLATGEKFYDPLEYWESFEKRHWRIKSTYGEPMRAIAYSDPAVKLAVDALKGAGGKVYVVGGAIRDLLLDKQPKDIDLLVQGVPADATRRALEALPGRVDLTGKDFGVFRYRHAGHEVEIALPRRERSTGDAHTDFDVQADHTMSIQEDLGRRDFTANAIAVDLDDGELIDPFGGAKDIKQGVLRVVGPKSFEEDPLRIVRALGAYSRHGLVPDQVTKEQMKQSADGLNHLPAERIQVELDKIMASNDPAGAIKLAHDTGILGYILPEVEQHWDYDQNNAHHALPLGEHLVETLKNVSSLTDDPDVRMAALLHDIGKPESAWVNPDTGQNHYYQNEQGQGKNHETHGALLVDQRLKALKYPTNRTDRIRSLVEHHMYPNFSSPKGARKFLNRTGDHADDLLLLRDADRDSKGTPEYQEQLTPVEVQRDLIQQIRSTGEPTNRSELAIDGRDLIAAGFQPGPQMGQILNNLVDAVLESPELNTKETLLELAHAYSPA